MIRLQDNPPICWPETVLTPEIAQPWAAAYCKPRQEKALARDLYQKQIPYFLPMVMKETSSGGRRRRNLYPLFPSYLFLAADDTQTLEALKSDRIVSLIRPPQGGEKTFREELTALGTALRNFPDSLELQPRLTPGVPARIRSGPMAGIEGIVLQVGSRHKLWMGVSCLGVGATVEIHPDLVEPL
ncbi:MAG: hypothetical protein H0T51_03950 [Pirellulales bacterium]|nr:hypothetical protein [Pirellulales bacterium]